MSLYLEDEFRNNLIWHFMKRGAEKSNPSADPNPDLLGETMQPLNRRSHQRQKGANQNITAR
jgi:hypothetical protein